MIGHGLQIDSMMSIEIRDSSGKVLLVTQRRDDGIILFNAFLGRDLSGAVFDGLILEGAYFDDTSPVKNASFRGTDLYWADFSFCDAERATFEAADLRGASFKDTNLRFCTFCRANLGCDNLGGFGDFKRSDLCGADFSGTVLDQLMFDGAKYNSSTVFPDGFSPNDRGMIDAT
jgi:uncharacterized protein YjbI with pentapeptide repeats